MKKPFNIAEFRKESQEHRDELQERFRAGDIDARTYTRGISDLTDKNMAKLADHFLGDHKDEITLVFTGGNGRQEVSPGSDLDILMVVPDSMDKDLSPELATSWSSFVTALWDLRLDPGALVRTVDQNREEAMKDQTVWSSLLDRRMIWGNEDQYERLNETMESLRKENWQHFLDEKLAESADRLANKSESRYVLQPDIKEGKGGLRDFHTMMWISKAVFECDTLEDLADEGLLTNREARRIQEAYDFLLATRCRVHDGHKGNVLSAEIQPDIAHKATGYEEEDRQQAIEEYMRDYFRNSREIGFLTNVICAAAIEKKEGDATPTRDVDGFTVRGDKIRFKDDKVADPLDLIRIYKVAQEQDVDIHPAALRTIKRNLDKVDDTFVNNPEANKMFMDVLTSSSDTAISMRRMQETGFLQKFLPPFDGIDMMMQFDPYHTYTVDEHIFQSIERANALEGDSLDEVAKNASVIASGLDESKRRTLHMALLFHDAGKDITETGDEDVHPERGGDMVREYGPRLGLTKAETERASWLVENHLLLSHTAQRRDLSDPWTVELFAQKVGSETNLDLLTVVTTADIMANGPNAWEPNTSVRIANLFHKTKGHMRSESFTPPPAFAEEHEAEGTQVRMKNDFMRNATVVDVVIPEKHRAFERLTVALAANGASIVGMDFEAAQDAPEARSTIWIQNEQGKTFDEARHAELSEKLEKAFEDESIVDMDISDKPKFGKPKSVPYRLQPEVELTNDISEQCTVIEVTAPDRPSLLNNVAKIFNEHGLVLQHARVSTLGRNYKAHDTFYVIDEHTGEQVDPERFDEIRDAILDSPALDGFE